MPYDVRSLQQLESVGKNLILVDVKTSGTGTPEQAIAYALTKAEEEGWTVVGVNNAFAFLHKEPTSEPGEVWGP